MTDENNASVLNSVKLLPEQILTAWEAVSVLPLPEEYREAKQIVVSGMGGSALGGRILKYYASPNMPIPVDVVSHYDLPEYVDEQTLVIISSYSGTTEETISAFKHALEKHAMIFVISTGGVLESMAIEEGVPAYIFNPEHNPSGQPRMATGYSIGAIFSLLSSIRLLHLAEGEMTAAVSAMRDYIESIANNESNDNPARELANKIHNKIPVLVSSEHLLGALHVYKNQLNECAKTFSMMFDIPELNHHLMEGLVNPEGNKNLLFVLFKSNLYHERVQKRYQITEDVIQKNSIDFAEYTMRSETRLQQIFELLVLGSFAQIYLAELYGVNMVEIPWVDYFKEQLAG